jgi:hypothetical protein
MGYDLYIFAVCHILAYKYTLTEFLHANRVALLHKLPHPTAMTVSIFIDESGDAGMKRLPGSSSHFVIAMVLFRSSESMANATAEITKLKMQHLVRAEEEFKFYKARPELRKTFLRALANHDFTVRAMIVDKKLVRGEELKNNTRSFYSFFIKAALHSDDGLLNGATIRIDGSGGREFKREFITYLRRELMGASNGSIKDASFLDSRQEPLIQLADMVAGSIMRFYARGDATYRDILIHRIEREWPFQ